MKKTYNYLILACFTCLLLACNQPDKSHKHLDGLMEKWHKDVATFKVDEYFNFMHTSFIFLGTAPNERWNKTEFLAFAKPFFESNRTWDFKPKWRNWYFSNTGNIAWFEEGIDTWMEECRASGVLIYEGSEWKIAHYNLSVLIENEKIKEFIELRKE